MPTPRPHDVPNTSEVEGAALGSLPEGPRHVVTGEQWRAEDRRCHRRVAVVVDGRAGALRGPGHATVKGPSSEPENRNADAGFAVTTCVTRTRH